MVAGAGLYVAGTYDDVATARTAARRFNRRREGFTVMPTANARGGGLTVIGAF